jgi:hypothetical protein
MLIASSKLLAEIVVIGSPDLFNNENLLMVDYYLNLLFYIKVLGNNCFNFL